jgi:putative transferase (TIGR04331 family)
MDAEVLPYHWDDRAKMHADYLYLQEFHERLLRELTTELNQIHGVNHSLRYWRILLGPWLGYFVQMVFDRWTSIQQSIREHELSGTIVLFGQEELFVPSNMVDFLRLFISDEWNHHIYAAILQGFTGVRCTMQAREDNTGGSRAESAATWKRRMRQRLAKSYVRLAGTFTRDRDAFFLGTYLPFRDEMRMHRRLRQVPQLWRPVSAIQIGVDATKRRWVVGGESRSEFEVCARALIPGQMPALYVEGYLRLVELTAHLPWPKKPKVIWTSISHNADDIFKAWAADKVEHGSPLVIGQHGGHYGVGRWSFTEDHDVAISDGYLSWGWSDQQRSNVKPVGQLKAKRPLEVRHAVQPYALMVVCSLPRFSYWMYSALVSRQWLDYFSNQCAFVDSLPRPIRDALIVRLYPEDYGWDQLCRWRGRFPDLRVDRGKSNIDDLICLSRLYISTYNATTFLESFTRNVPTVIYWNPKHWELRESAEPYFGDLRRVGIFHETPESAAHHVAAIWDDVDAWWSSTAVREVLGRFKERYCRLPDDLMGCVEGAIREVMIAADATSRQ